MIQTCDYKFSFDIFPNYETCLIVEIIEVKPRIERVCAASVTFLSLMAFRLTRN